MTATTCEEPAMLEPVTDLEVITVLLDDAGKPAVEWCPNHDLYSRVAGGLILHSGRKCSAYSLEETPGDDGNRAIILKKLAGGTDDEAAMYCVQVSQTGAPVGCECRGFLRWGKPCKHLNAVGALVANGMV